MAGRGAKAKGNGRGGLRPGQSKPGQTTHGFYALQALLKRRTLDGRSTLGQLVKQRRQEFEDNYGGKDALPIPKRTLLNRALFKIVLLDSMEYWAFMQPSLIGKDGTLPPVLATCYLSWAAELRRDLVTLGLQRVAKDVDQFQAEIDRLVAEQEAEAKADGGGDA